MIDIEREKMKSGIVYITGELLITSPVVGMTMLDSHGDKISVIIPRDIKEKVYVKKNDKEVFVFNNRMDFKIFLNENIQTREDLQEVFFCWILRFVYAEKKYDEIPYYKGRDKKILEDTKNAIIERFKIVLNSNIMSTSRVLDPFRDCFFERKKDENKDLHEKFMRRCYELAISAGKKGHDTFGAVLVHDGKILEEAENTDDYEKKIFGHAEFNLVHKCANKYSDDVLSESILYTSCAPCERCLGAIASLRVHNIICGVSYKEFCKLLPFDYKPIDREGLLRELGIFMTIEESVLEDEGMHVFEWWGGKYRPLEELIAKMDEVKRKKSID